MKNKHCLGLVQHFLVFIYNLIQNQNSEIWHKNEPKDKNNEDSIANRMFGKCQLKFKAKKATKVQERQAYNNFYILVFYQLK